MSLPYNLSIFSYHRVTSREVKVRDVGIGGTNPIRIQSMITSDTQDVPSSVEQVLALERAGSELVRITVPTMKDAHALVEIRQKLKQVGSKVPLVADIHFTPSVAMFVIDHVDKVRINPGNFVDKKKFAIKDYTDKEYSLELEKIAEIFIPLVRKCKQSGVPLRIGTNHGSLSDRIMNRYGDTPLGMCESALEFIRISESESFYDIVVSMKSSNPQVMVQAYRLLSAKFIENGMKYPFHLGVTEAGDGNDGRIKSAMGIGSLLQDGIGDTIRVSLTEDSIYEIPAANRLVKKYNTILKDNSSFPIQQPYSVWKDPFTYSRMNTIPVSMGSFLVGDRSTVRIESHYNDTLENGSTHEQLFISPTGLRNVDTYHITLSSFEQAISILSQKEKTSSTVSLSVTPTEPLIQEGKFDILNQFDKVVFDLSILKDSDIVLLLGCLKKYVIVEIQLQPINFLDVNQLISILIQFQPHPLVLSVKTDNVVFDYRKLLSLLIQIQLNPPILLHAEYETFEDALFDASSEIGSLLLDGIGDAIRIITKDKTCFMDNLNLSYDILQAARLRTTKTEFISCPSCGRTLFNLQDTTERIKSKTGHLKGIKIAVMGCIVNGPGEMADADFGYVGAGQGKVHLYKGKEIVKKSIPSEIADEELISLIKENYLWIDP
jgi:(E)-4-hydroxy-3-methylbut-2-enyl-diphosphate synthase